MTDLETKIIGAIAAYHPNAAPLCEVWPRVDYANVVEFEHAIESLSLQGLILASKYCVFLTAEGLDSYLTEGFHDFITQAKGR